MLKKATLAALAVLALNATPAVAAPAVTIAQGREAIGALGVQGVPTVQLTIDSRDCHAPRRHPLDRTCLLVGFAAPHWTLSQCWRPRSRWTQCQLAEFDTTGVAQVLATVTLVDWRVAGQRIYMRLNPPDPPSPKG
jgi:hypothetical protein